MGLRSVRHFICHPKNLSRARKQHYPIGSKRQNLITSSHDDGRLPGRFTPPRVKDLSVAEETVNNDKGGQRLMPKRRHLHLSQRHRQSPLSQSWPTTLLLTWSYAKIAGLLLSCLFEHMWQVMSNMGTPLQDQYSDLASPQIPEPQTRYLDGDKEVEVVDIPRQALQHRVENVAPGRTLAGPRAKTLPGRYRRESDASQRTRPPAKRILQERWDQQPSPHLEFGMGWSSSELFTGCT